MKRTGMVGGVLRYLSDPLRKNSLFLMATHGVIALFGFFFWRIAEGLYGTGDVEVAVTLVSAVLLLHTLARLGIDIGLIRFLPREEDKAGMINTSFTMVGIVSAGMAVIFILGIRVWTPALGCIREDPGYALLFIVFTVAVGLVELLRQGVFVAYRKTEWSLAIEVVAGLRLPLLFAFLSLGALGIFISWGLAGVTALVAGVLLLMVIQRTYRPVPKIRGKVVGDMVRFSLGNYVAESFREIPGFVLPIIVVSVFTARAGTGSGTGMGAYFYIAWTMASVVMMISYATGSSLLAEGSAEPAGFRRNATRAVRFMLLLLAPAIVLVFVFGDNVLAWFGAPYSENAFSLLRVLSVSAIPIAVNTVYVTQKRVQRKMWPVVWVYAFVAAFTVGVGYALIDRMELLGIGVAWLAANCVVAGVAGSLMSRAWLQARREKNQGNADASTS